jgi:glycosyltransferase involved in cell wall biosynthesis
MRPLGAGSGRVWQVRVMHVGPRPDPASGNGVDVASWPLLQAQVAAGAEVSMLIAHPASEAELDIARRAGVTVTTARQTRIAYARGELDRALNGVQPDVVHLHSVFIPAQAQLCAKLRRAAIPYAVTPHGGLNLFRGRWKKAVYGAVIERRRLGGAGALFVLTAREEAVLKQWLGGRPVPYVELPNPAPALVGEETWTPPRKPAVVFLGRYDVYKKGLDRFVGLARLLPEVDFRGYGSASAAERQGFERLVGGGLPSNVAFLAPVHGVQKTQALQTTTMYLHPARNEGFGMSIVEAMALGVPVAMSADCDLADGLRERQAALILPDDLREAAAMLKGALEDRHALHAFADAGDQWVRDALDAELLAARSLETYEALLGALPSRRR